MKIVFCMNTLASGGAERVCVEMCNFFIEKGHQVTILVKPNSGKRIYKLHKDIFLKEFFFVRPSKKNILFYPYLLWKFVKSIYNLIKVEKPDVVISFCTSMNAFTIPVANKLKIPIIASEHTNNKNGGRLINFVRHNIYKKSDVITLLTEYDANYYKAFLNNFVVMQNPIQTYDNVDVATERKKHILCVGNLERNEQKRFDRAIDAFSLIADKYPEWNLLIAGSGDKLFFEKMIEDKGLQGRVKLMGQVSNMKDLYLETSIFALSSKIEGLPMVLLEAMSLGCAPVSFDIVSGPNEVIVNGKSGFLVEDGDIDGFADKISLLIENEEIRQQIACEAVKVSQDFSIEKIGNRWLSLLNSLIESK